MFTRQSLVGSFVLLPLLAGQPLAAQRVRADIRIGDGPIFGHVVIGDRWDYRPRPRGYVIIQPRVVRVERVYFKDRGRRDRWFRNFREDARVVVVYYDDRDDCYYDRGGPGLQEIEVFERDGRFYRPDDYYGDRRRNRDDRYDRSDDGGRDRGWAWGRDRDRDRRDDRDRDDRRDH